MNSSTQGPEDPQGDHPEIRNEDPEAKLPAAAQAKEDLLTQIKEQLGPKPEGSRPNRWGQSFVDPDDNRAVGLTLFTEGGSWENPDEVASISVLDRDTLGPRRQETYSFIQAPDGLEVEPSHALLPPMRPMAEAMAPYQDSDDALIEQSLDEIAQGRQAAIDERALNLRFFSQRDARILLERLARMQPFRTP